MSILINLLPDTRQAKQRDHQRRQLATGIAVVVWVVVGGIVVLLTLYMEGQKLAIGNYNKQISDKETQLQGTSGLLDALTAQQHLNSLPQLYNQRVYLTKFFTAYTAANPNDVTVSSLVIDNTNAMTINGTGRTYAAVAKLAKALEADNVTVGSGANSGNQPYFTNVAIQSVSRSNNQVNFTLNATVGSGATSGK